MIALSLNSLSFPLQAHLQLQSSKTHLHNPTSCPKFSSTILLQSIKLRSKTTKLRSKSNTPFENEPKFMDENGVVNDMDGYLNSLSLEYDSVWDTKPSWCQPWTIALTGVSVIACSWLALRSIIVTLLVSTLIFAWWYIFLYSYPKTYTEMIAERRKKVKSGTEDTYGWSKNQ
ncbi:Palmitoyltransferase pfa4 [Bienertia sinuspersici]